MNPRGPYNKERRIKLSVKLRRVVLFNVAMELGFYDSTPPKGGRGFDRRHDYPKHWTAQQINNAVRSGITPLAIAMDVRRAA